MIADATGAKLFKIEQVQSHKVGLYSSAVLLSDKARLSSDLSSTLMAA